MKQNNQRDFTRPFDILKDSKGNEVKVELRNGSVIRGKIKTFDTHVNLVLEEAYFEGEDEKKNIFVRGDSILYISNL